MKYYRSHLNKLCGEARSRYDHLLHVLQPDTSDRGLDVMVDGYAIRLAVDDFKVILAEIRKLK